MCASRMGAEVWDGPSESLMQRKARYWQQTLGEAARSGMSIREYCRRRRLKESQFYWWQRRLRLGPAGRSRPRPGGTGKRRVSRW
jgi:hypothetical protein